MPPRSCAATRAKKSSSAATARSKARSGSPRCSSRPTAKTNRRIAALISVICLALLVFCLVERAVRKAIAPASARPSPPPSSLLGCMSAARPSRPAKPTGRLVFEALASLRLNPARGHDPPTIPTPPPLQAKLLELLNVDPTRPRRAS